MAKGRLATTWEGIQADQSSFSSLNRSFRLAEHGETQTPQPVGVGSLRPGLRPQVDGAPVEPKLLPDLPIHCGDPVDQCRESLQWSGLWQEGRVLRSQL